MPSTFYGVNIVFICIYVKITNIFTELTFHYIHPGTKDFTRIVVKIVVKVVPQETRCSAPQKPSATNTFLKGLNIQ